MDWLIDIVEIVLGYGMIVFLSIDNSAEKHQEPLRCDPCTCSNKNEHATAYCLDCPDPEAFCENCARKHLTMRTSRHHVLSADMTSLRLWYLIEGLHPRIHELSCAICADMHIKATSFCMGCDYPEPMCTGCADLHVLGRNDSKKHFIWSDIQIFHAWVKGDIPGKPYVESKHQDGISLKWIDKISLSSNEFYQLRYKKCPDGKWFVYKVSAERSFTVTGLLPETAYQFQVRVINYESGINKVFGPASDIIMSPESATTRLLKKSKMIKDGIPCLYMLPSTEVTCCRNEAFQVRKLTLGNIKVSNRERNIMIVGATGSGKSTLLNAIANYVVGVNWNDTYRFSLTSLEVSEHQKEGHEAVSQTEWISCYTICSDVASRLDYTVNLIDTPGFGDTRGLSQDERIVAQISHFFKSKDSIGVSKIDAVCFVLKAPDNRLTASQKYIFESVLAIFGKDMKNNICSLITFCDGQIPQVLSAIKALDDTPLPFDTYFEFNNSALFSSNAADEQNQRCYWNLGMKSCEHFFNHIKQLEPVYLDLTCKLLSIRSNHDNLVHLIQTEVTKCEMAVCVLEEQMELFEKSKREISFNTDYRVIDNKIHYHREDIAGKGIHTTTCRKCNVTCHENCPYAMDSMKHKCVVMDKSGNCTSCPGKCDWQSHSNVPYILKKISESVNKTNLEMESRYQVANERKRLLKHSIEQKFAEQKTLQNSIQEKITLLKTYAIKIKEIGLRHQPLNSVEYIQLIIECEKCEKRNGFNKRIEKLQQYIKRASLEKTFCNLKDRCSNLQNKLQN